MDKRLTVAYVAILVLALSGTLPWAMSDYLSPYSERNTLQLRGHEYVLFTRPLDSYFSAHPEAVPKPGLHWTGQKREGYQAAWELSGDSLFLTDIVVGRFSEGFDTLPEGDSLPFGDGKWVHTLPEGYENFYKAVSVLDEVFPNRTRVPALWFTGYLIVPVGDSVAPCDSHSSRLAYESFLIIAVVDGLRRDEISLSSTDFCEFQDRQFAAYQLTSEYQEKAAESRAYDDSMRAVDKRWQGSKDYASFSKEWDFETYMTMMFGN